VEANVADNWSVVNGVGKGYPFAVVAPYNDGLPGTAVLGAFAYRPHAELAASAPDLLEALKEARKFLPFHLPDSDGVEMQVGLAFAWQQIDAAIAKATRATPTQVEKGGAE
jgi:hypothetical protein